jgi:hypothetical protein
MSRIVFRVLVVSVGCAIVIPAPSASSYTFGSTVTGGSPQLVLDKPSTPGCGPDYADAPDSPPRALHDQLGRLHLVMGGRNRGMVGSNFDNLLDNCTELLVSGADTDPSHFNYSEFLTSPYFIGVGDTNSGWPAGTIVALIHEEFHGEQIQPTPAVCEPAPASCRRKSMVMARSANNNISYDYVGTPPADLVASLPYQLDDTFNGAGYVGPTNIVRVADPSDPTHPWYYAMFSPKGPFRAQAAGACVMRTKTLMPNAWRAWGDGTDAGRDPGFEVQFVNPYLGGSFNDAEHVCTPVKRTDNGNALLVTARSLVYSSFLGKYMLIGGGGAANFVYSVSDDMVTWGPPQLLMQDPDDDPACPGAQTIAYPSLIDEGDNTANYESTDQRAQLYFIKWHYVSCTDLGWDRDVYKVPVDFAPLRTASGAAICLTDGFDQYKLSPPGGSSGFAGTTDNYGGASGSYLARVSPGSQYAQGVFGKDQPPTGPGGAGCIADSRPNIKLDRGDDVWYSGAFKFVQGFWGAGQPLASVTLLKVDDNGSNVAGAVSIGTDRRIHFVTTDGSANGSINTELAYDSSGNPGVPAPQDSCWHLVEVHQHLGIDGKASNNLYMDGQLVNTPASALNARNWYGAAYDRLRAGISTTPILASDTVKVGVDSVRLNYNGPSSYSPPPC